MMTDEECYMEKSMDELLDSMSEKLGRLQGRVETLYDFLDTVHDEGMHMAKVLMDYEENNGLLLSDLENLITALKTKSARGEK